MSMTVRTMVHATLDNFLFA